VEQFLFPSYLAGKKIQENVPAACGCWNQRKSFFLSKFPEPATFLGTFLFIKVSRTCHVFGTCIIFQKFWNLPRFLGLILFSNISETCHVPSDLHFFQSSHNLPRF
jgi:hypothetical protein